MDGSEWGVQQDDSPHPAYVVCQMHLDKLGGIPISGDDMTISYTPDDCRCLDLCPACPFKEVKIRG